MTLGTSGCALDWKAPTHGGGSLDAETPRPDGAAGGDDPNSEIDIDGGDGSDAGLDAEVVLDDGTVPQEDGSPDGQRVIEDAGPPLAPGETSGQIAAVRQAIRSGDPWAPITVRGAVVTYVRRGVGDNPVGSSDGPAFYVQNGTAGPALLIAMDPATTVPGGVRVGDILDLTISAGDAPDQLVVVTGASARLVGEGALLPQAQTISALDLLDTSVGLDLGEYDLESELVTGTVTIDGAFVGAGFGFSSAYITTGGEPVGSQYFVLRGPTEWVSKLFATCTVKLLGTPLSRYRNKLQLSVWDPTDAEITCPELAVVNTFPADGGTNVALLSAVRVQFNQAVQASEITTQVTAGPCTGAVQLSADNFASCLPFATANAEVDASGTVSTMHPGEKFAIGTTYAIRVVSGVKALYGSPLASTVTSTFTTTSEVATCGPAVVISQVYGGGGNTGAMIGNDFIELHNRGAAPASLSGWSVQYASSSASWLVQPLPDVSIPGGGYYLIKETGGTVSGTPLQGADTQGTMAMGSRAGRVALVAGTTATSAADPLRLDLVVYGTGAWSPPIEGASTGDLSNTTAALRNDDGCADTNDNFSDFTVGTPSPRNSASTLKICACSQ
ncbi:MAG: lamin tail domain-containing protein [Myxococcales bacterium]